MELFSWKTTSHKDHLEVYLPNSRLLSGLIRMWSSVKITLNMGMTFHFLLDTLLVYMQKKLSHEYLITPLALLII